MKSLLIKEGKLAASPLSFLFLLFAFMTMIPGYPILVGSFFVCLGIFYSFQQTRETNDILYTVLLPIDKRGVVRAKYIFTCGIELAAFMMMALLTALRMGLWADAPVYANNVMMNANLVYLAFDALIFALFNGVFLGGFFRTAYKIGKPFVVFAALAMLVVIVGEALHHFPGLEFLNGSGRLPLQTAVLVAALIVYAVVTLLSCRRAGDRFEALDL